MNIYDQVIFLGYTSFVAVMILLAMFKTKNLGVGFMLLIMMVIVGYIGNIPDYGYGVVSLAMMAIASLITYKFILSEPEGGIRIDLQSIIASGAMFIIVTNFGLDLILYNQFTMVNNAPSIGDAFNITYAWNQALNLLGGQWSFLGYSFAFIEDFFAGVLTVVLFIIGAFTWIGLTLAWIIGVIEFPFALLPAPLSQMLSLIFDIYMAMGMFFGIRFLYTDIKGRTE